MKNVFYLLMILTGTILLSGCDDKDKTDIMKEELQQIGRASCRERV